MAPATGGRNTLCRAGLARSWDRPLPRSLGAPAIDAIRNHVSLKGKMMTRMLPSLPVRAKGAGLAAAMAMALAQPGAAAEMSLDLGLQAFSEADESLVALFFDGAPTQPDSQLERVVRVPVPAQETASPQRLTLRLTDLTPGRYGLAIYPNESLGRLDLTGVGTPRPDLAPRAGPGRAARFQYAMIRIEDSTYTLSIKLTY